MQKEIKNTIENYYNDIILLRYFSYKLLTESQHETTVFDIVIKDIIKLINNLINNSEDLLLYPYQFFSKWIYDSTYNKCLIYNYNGLKTNQYLIYIRLIYDVNSPKYAAIKNRIINKLSELQIMISINCYYLLQNIDLFAMLKHEFLHGLEMYITDKNILNLPKNTDYQNITDIFDITTNIHFQYFNMVKRILYLLSESEQRGHINGIIGFLKNNKDVLLIVSDTLLLPHDKIFKLIDISEKYCNNSEINKIEKTLAKQFNNDNLLLLLILGYYLNKENNIFKKYKNILNYNYLITIIRTSDYLFNNEEKETALTIKKYIDNNFKKYFLKLYSSILNNIIY